MVRHAEGAAIVVSDGTQTKPYCSWYAECAWNPTTQGLCAQQVCAASNYTRGTFVAGDDMCTTTVVDGDIWIVLVDADMSTRGPEYLNYRKETEITASCWSCSSCENGIDNPDCDVDGECLSCDYGFVLNGSACVPDSATSTETTTSTTVTTTHTTTSSTPVTTTTTPGADATSSSTTSTAVTSAPSTTTSSNISIVKSLEPGGAGQTSVHLAGVCAAALCLLYSM